MKTVPGHAPGNYVVPNIAGHTPKKRDRAPTSSAINFDGPECWLTKEDGINAQQVIAGIAFQPKIKYENQTIQEEVSDILAAVGLFQYIIGGLRRDKTIDE